MKEKIFAGLTIPLTLGIASLALLWNPAAALDPGVAIMNASNGIFNADTFSINGTIASLTFTQTLPYILTGDWSLDVASNSVAAFHASINALKSDGSDSQDLKLANFVSDGHGVVTNTDGSKVISGYVDIVSSNQTSFKIPMTLSVEKLKAVSIILGQTHSGILMTSQPIYGTVKYPNLVTQTSSAAASPLLPEGNGGALSKNSTPPIVLPQLPNLFFH